LVSCAANRDLQPFSAPQPSATMAQQNTNGGLGAPAAVEAADPAATRLYRDAQAALHASEHEEAVKLFRELEDNYPHLDLARRAMLGVAYALFLDADYQGSIDELTRFMGYYRLHKDMDYARYLEAVNTYMQMPGRDSGRAKAALATLEAFVRDFPDSRYAEDASAKARDAAEALAAKHLSIGRFYQDQDQLLAAINRFQIVVRDYPQTSRTPEALHRLVECFTALGVIDEAQRIAQALASGYAQTAWVKDSQDLIASEAPAKRDASALKQVAGAASAGANEAQSLQREGVTLSAAAPRRGGSEGGTASGDRLPRIPAADSPYNAVSLDARPGGSTYRASSAEHARLGRWHGIGEAAPGAQTDGWTSANSDSSWVPVERVVSGEASDFADAWSSPTRGGDWEEDASMSSDLQLSNGALVSLDHSYSGERIQDDKSFGVAFVGLADGWNQNTLNDTALAVGLWGDALELTSQHSVSRHVNASTADDGQMGQGYFQGLNAKLLQNEDVSLSISGAYGISDDAYGISGIEDDDEDDDDEEGLSGVPGTGTEGKQYGLEAGFALGFADLALAHDQFWRTQDTDEDFGHLQSSTYLVGLSFDALDLALTYNESLEAEGHGKDREDEATEGYEAEAKYKVRALREIVGDAFGAAFWDYAPTSISASYGIEESKDSDGAHKEKTTLAFGTSWDWDAGYASVSYYYSFTDDLVAGSDDSKYRSDGFDVGGGWSEDKWAFYGGLSVSRSAGLGQWNESTEIGIDPYFSLSYEADRGPDLSLSGSTSYYESNYISDGGTSRSQSWEVLTELDFAKFWPEALNEEDEGLKLVYQLTSESELEKWGGEASRESTLDHFVGLKVDLNLGDQ
jgi:outer membrane protein assembly factor BamD